MSEMVLGDGLSLVECAAEWIAKVRSAGFAPKVIEDGGRLLLDIDVDTYRMVPLPDLVGAIIGLLAEEPMTP